MVVFFGAACGKPLPKKRYSQFLTQTEILLSPDSLYLFLDNPLESPLRFFLSSKDSTLGKIIEPISRVLLSAKTDTQFTFFPKPNSVFDTSSKVGIGASLGNPNDALRLNPLSLPFLPHRSYSIIQGYNGSYSHKGNFSRYAIDFGTAIGDTICAADKGFVVGVIKAYQYGGNSQKWRDYANYITLFHPHSNLYTQYVHLKHQGAFVEVGDEVQMGQAIGLSGMTGWTDIPHLHFNAFYPKEGEFFGSPVEFLEGYKGKDLKRNDQVTKGEQLPWPLDSPKFPAFKEAIIGLRELTYELTSFETLSKEENFLNKRIVYLNTLRKRTDKPLIPLISELSVVKVFRAEVKSTHDRGGKLYNRATLESWLCENEQGAKGLKKQIDALQDTVSWMHISKSPITYWQQGKELRFITPGGFYMLEDVPEIHTFLLEYKGKEQAL